MKLHFEPNLDYQHAAIESVCDLFLEATIQESRIVRRAGIALDCPRPVKAGGL